MWDPLLLSLYWYHPLRFSSNCLSRPPFLVSSGSWLFVPYSRRDSLSRGDPDPFQHVKWRSCEHPDGHTIQKGSSGLMIVLHQNKKRREPGGKNVTGTMMLWSWWFHEGDIIREGHAENYVSRVYLILDCFHLGKKKTKASSRHQSRKEGLQVCLPHTRTPTSETDLFGVLCRKFVSRC